MLCLKAMVGVTFDAGSSVVVDAPHPVGPRSRNLAAWLSGWFNLLGQVGSTAGVAYTSAGQLTTLVGAGAC